MLHPTTNRWMMKDTNEWMVFIHVKWENTHNKLHVWLFFFFSCFGLRKQKRLRMNWMNEWILLHKSKVCVIL
jgi:hypothetical protein